MKTIYNFTQPDATIQKVNLWHFKRDFMIEKRLA